VIYALAVVSSLLATGFLSALFALTGNAVEAGMWVTGTEIARHPMLGEWSHTSDTCYLPRRVVQMVRTRPEGAAL
jgi:hypothetical protein